MLLYQYSLKWYCDVNSVVLPHHRSYCAHVVNQALKNNFKKEKKKLLVFRKGHLRKQKPAISGSCSQGEYLVGEACSVKDLFIPGAENKSNQQPISFRLPASSCLWGRAVTCTLTWPNYEAISGSLKNRTIKISLFWRQPKFKVMFSMLYLFTSISTDSLVSRAIFFFNEMTSGKSLL